MVFERLFGSHPWLADREAATVIDKKITELGLREHIPGEIDTSRATPLGNELQLDLLLVFLGILDKWDIAYILEKYGLIETADSEQIYHLLGAGVDPESVMRSRVQKAYYDYYNPTRLLN